MARDARADVELVDDDAGTPPDVPTPGTDDHRSRRRALVIGAAVVAVLVAAGIAGQAVVNQRERDRLAALEGVPGLLDPVDGPLRPVELPPLDGTAWVSARAATGVLVGAVLDDQGRAYAAGVRPDDPAHGWETTLFTIDRTAEDEGEAASFGGMYGCETVAPERTQVMCFAEAVAAGSTDPQAPPGPTLGRRLVLLAPADGTVVADLTDDLPAWTRMQATVLDDVLVVAGSDDDGGHVRALTTEGETLWDLALPEVRPGSWVGLEAGDGTTAVVTDERALLVDASGSVLQEVRVSQTTHARATHGDEFVLPLFETSEVLLLGPGGSRTLPGAAVPLVVDDGSVPGLTLTVDRQGLHAWDADSTELWTSGRAPEQAAILLDGRLTIGSGTGVVTLDATTGEELWRADGLLPDSGLATDGRVVLVMAPEAETGARRHVVALDLRDGDEAWRTTLPTSVDHVTANLGVLMTLSWSEQVDDETPFGVRVSVLR